MRLLGKRTSARFGDDLRTSSPLDFFYGRFRGEEEMEAFSMLIVGMDRHPNVKTRNQERKKPSPFPLRTLIQGSLVHAGASMWSGEVDCWLKPGLFQAWLAGWVGPFTRSRSQEPSSVMRKEAKAITLKRCRFALALRLVATIWFLKQWCGPKTTLRDRPSQQWCQSKKGIMQELARTQ
jgi:hypothetical protein